MVDIGRRENVVDDIVLAAIDRAMFADKPLPRDQQAFEIAVEAGRAEVVPVAEELERLLLEILQKVAAIKRKIRDNKNPLAIALAVSDIQQQLSHLVYKGFISRTPAKWLEHYPRYFAAIEQRLDKAAQNPARDRSHSEQLSDLWALHAARLQKDGPWAYEDNEAWQLYRWMIEELRVSFFAQTLKTLMPVSAKRLKKQWEASQNA